MKDRIDENHPGVTKTYGLYVSYLTCFIRHILYEFNNFVCHVMIYMINVFLKYTVLLNIIDSYF